MVLGHDNSQDETAPAAPGSGDLDFDLDATRTVVQSIAPTASAPAPTTTSHVALPIPYTIHEYTIEAVLGVGGFGLTYLAQDNNLQCRVAIKEYLPSDLALRGAGQTVIPRSDTDIPAYKLGLERFLAEARVLATFRHPNIVRVSRFFEANQTAYMVMDYERGESLRSWRENHGAPDEAKLTAMFLPLLEGLETVHRAGIVHRDIKPANIYVRDSDGSVVLLDFGAARQTTGGVSKSLTSIITPGYAPMEQYHARGAQGPWSDLYSLAGVLYWLVTGQKPLEAPTRIKDDTMPRAATVAADRFSQGFLSAIDWGLMVDEDARPRSVAEFRRVLVGEMPVPKQGAAEIAAVPPQPTSPAAASRRSKLPAIAAAVVAMAVLALFVMPPSAPPPQTPVASSTDSPRGDTAPNEAAPVAAKDKAASATPGAHVASKAPVPAGDQSPRSGAAAKGEAAKAAVAAGGPSATLVFDIAPAGEQAEVTVDGRKVGTAPPLRELKVAPGPHKVTIHGSKPPNVYYYWVDVKPNESRRLWARFANAF